MWIRSGMRFDRNRAHSLSISRTCLSSTVMLCNSLRLPSTTDGAQELSEYVREWVTRERAEMRAESRTCHRRKGASMMF